MSEVSNQNRRGNGRAGRRSASRMQMHLDMTPMVDLAFLLLTFFMLSASFLIQKRMEVTLPKSSGAPALVNCHKAITLMVMPGDKLYYYTCYEESGLKSVPFSNDGLSSLLKLSEKEKSELVVLIKMDDHAAYERFVNVVDVLKANGIAKYSLGYISNDDKTILKDKAHI